MPLHMIRGNLLDMDTDAIVNATNTGLRAGGGVCGAIFEAAGRRELQAACDAIGGCETGKAVITPGFRLRARYVIHTAGPVWQGGTQGEEKLLASCYQSALALAAANGLNSIAFPLISSGVYGYPEEQAMGVAVAAIAGFLLQHDDMEVRLVIYNRSEGYREREQYRRLAGYIDAHMNQTGTEEPDADGLRAEGTEPGVQPAGGLARRISFAAPSAAAPSFRAEEPPPKGDGTEPAFLRRVTEQKPPQKTVRAGQALSGQNETAALRTPEGDVSPHTAGHGGMRGTATGWARSTVSSAARERTLDEAIAHLGDRFSESVLHLIDRKGCTDVEVYKRANLDRKLFSKLRTDPGYRPSKSTAVALCVALELNLDEARDLLGRAGYALSLSSKGDLIVAYFIEHGNYNIFELNEALFAFDQPCLGV